MGPHDVNDINCPATMPTARLTGTRLRFDFRESIRNTAQGQEITIKVLTSMIDTALLELINRRSPRPTVGVKKMSTYKGSLQNVFPAIFCPGRSKEVDSRVHLISKISSSIINCKKRSNLPDPHHMPANVVDGSEFVPTGWKQEICPDPVDTSTLQNSLFTAIVQNTGHNKRDKALQPLTSGVLREGLSKQLTELPDMTESLSLFDQSAREVGSSPTHLFFQYSDPVEEKNVECPTKHQVPTDVAVNHGPIPMLRALPSFEDITLEDPHDGTLLEDCDSVHGLARQPCSEASSSFRSLSKVAYGFPNWEPDDHVSMLRETHALTEGCLPIVSSANAAWPGVIGEDGGLTQSPTRSSPPDGCTRVMCLHEQVRALNASQHDKASEERLSEDLFGTLALEQPLYQAPTFSQPTISNVEHLATTKPLHTVPDFEGINLLQEVDYPMNIESVEEPSLADLLREEKFSQDMWNRRRSTAINDNPSTFQPSMPTKTIGAGWRLKPAARDAQQTPTRPAASYQRRNSRSPVDQDDSRPYGSKRSSVTSISSSAPQSPTEQKPQRRDSLLRRWSRGSTSPSDQEMLDFDISSIEQRTVEVKRRKTIEDYDRQDRLEHGEEDEDMLFA